ncbi:geranylgeranyl pyrophosphate synthetase [Maudiozyma exigua]|uniref:Geranylgeranyl pyrophosphate synthetase n=1 Tax=Maudiozyma exigua TaxID=34358 RepID=A0A9P6W6I6_MAUEX|nr:geranylgeranyl pyrophosphate synthetase [Kazachstania exigua]
MNKDKLKDLLSTRKEWTEANEHILQTPYLHIAQQEGKKFRSKLIATFAQFYRISPEDICKLQQIIEILHTASLMIDDIEDNSLMRRGVKTSHLLFGIPLALNSANYMYFIAMRSVGELGSSTVGSGHCNEELKNRLMTIFEEELINLHRGQGLELYWRDNNKIPTVDMYFDMVTNKTGGLFRLAIRLMECLSSYNEHEKQNQNIISNSLIPLCNMLGVIYQIRDDYLNLIDDAMQQKKGFAEDITEGKLSFPIIHGLKQESILIKKDTMHMPFLKNTLFSRTDDIVEKKKFINILQNETKSLEYTKETLNNIMSLLEEGDYYPIINNTGTGIDQSTVNALKAMIQKLATV